MCFLLPTVLGQNKRPVMNSHNAKSTSPNNFKFKLEVSGTSPFCFGKKLGRLEKTTLLFLLLFQKNRQQKKRVFFSQVVEISQIENRKNSQKSLIGGSLTLKSFWENFRSKHMGSPKISVGGPLLTISGYFLEKLFCAKAAKNDIFFKKSMENTKGNFPFMVLFYAFCPFLFCRKIYLHK